MTLHRVLKQDEEEDQDFHEKKKWMVRIYIVYLESHLRCKNELVLFKEASAGVHEHHVSDAVYQV